MRSGEEDNSDLPTCALTPPFPLSRRVSDSGKMRCLLDLLLSAGIGEGSADNDATSFWAGDVPDGGFEGEEGGGVGEADESVREIREEKEKVRSEGDRG